MHYLQDNQQPREFILKARNGEDEWTTLYSVRRLTWSKIGEGHTIFFPNNKAYNEYRLENIASGDASACDWKLNTLDLRSFMTTMTIPELSYSNSISVFKDVKMNEEYPNSEYYFGFSVSPALPAGIILDPNTGIISGKATVESASQRYSVVANKLTGGTSMTTFMFGSKICTGEQSIMSLVIRTDFYPMQASYKVYQGIGTSGSVIASIDRFTIPASMNYADFCEVNGIYTVELLDSAKDGWINPAGYYLTVDGGDMIVEMGQVPAGVSSVSTMFSTYFPFQINYSDWKVSKEYVNNWNAVDFDDSTWMTLKASKIGKNEEITTYIRHDVNIPDINNYHVLNIRVKYAGGVAAYFNGKLVARFNLEKDFDGDSKSISTHDANIFSKFHVILNHVGAMTGKNVMGFEIHRPLNESPAIDVVFDATAVFGVNDCSIVVDSFSEVKGVYPEICSIEELLDLNPTTYGYQPNTKGSYLEWAVENLEGSEFNSFGMQTVYARTSYGFSLYGRSDRDEEYVGILAMSDEHVNALQRNAWSAPLGVVGFQQLRFEVDNAASGNVYVSSYILQYCKPNGSGMCPGIDDYPSVSEGELSYSSCEKPYHGYSYRICENGKLGSIHSENCIRSVVKGTCQSDGVFPSTSVDETAVYPCSMNGLYVGTLKRTCFSGDVEGIWGESSGFCLHVGLLIAIVFISGIVLLLCVFLALRVFRSPRPVVGVRSHNVVKNVSLV